MLKKKARQRRAKKSNIARMAWQSQVMTSAASWFRQEWSQNPLKWSPKSPKNNQSGAQERSWEQVSPKQSAPELSETIFGTTWPIFGVIWCSAWRQWDPRFESFGIRMRQKLNKCHPEWGPSKCMNFGLIFSEKNVIFWWCWTFPNALYKSISVVFADYDKIEHSMKIYTKMDTKSELKIDVWAIRGPTFEVLGCFFEELVFLNR